MKQWKGHLEEDKLEREILLINTDVKRYTYILILYFSQIIVKC